MPIDPNPESFATILCIAIVAIIGTGIVTAVRWHDRRIGRLSRVNLEERRLRCVKQKS